jgi:hypothetical protein
VGRALPGRADIGVIFSLEANDGLHSSNRKTVALRRRERQKDKLLACLNWRVGLSRESDPDYWAAPLYYDAAWEWYRNLSLGHQDSVSTILAAWSMHDRRKAAQKWAATLPPAPKCPL